MLQDCKNKTNDQSAEAISSIMAKWEKIFIRKCFFFDMVTYLPFELPSAMFTSHLLSKHRDKHCHRVSKWQKGFTFADVYLFLISIFFILIIEEIALQYEGLGFKKLSPICKDRLETNVPL